MGFVSQQFTPGFRLIDGSDLNSLVSQINSGPGSGPIYYVNESIGNDGAANQGFNPYKPLATLDAALTREAAQLASLGLSTVGRNAVVAFWGTQHRSATLTWNLPGTHLVGLCAGQRRGKRARISPLAGAAGFNYLVNVTAAGCYFGNFGTFYGFANVAGALVAWNDAGGHSYYDNVEFLGFGDATGGTGTANLTGARAFKFNNSVGETTWRGCVFGVDTVQRGATNYTVEIAGGAPRLTMDDCDFEAYLAAGGANGSHLLIADGGIDRYLKLQNCRLMSDTLGGPAGTAMAQALNVTVAAGGFVLLDSRCSLVGCTAIQTAPTANVVMTMTAPGAGGGKAITNA